MVVFLKKQEGFTFIEVIIAFVLIIMVAAAFVPLFANSFVNIYTYGNKDEAMAAASDYLEQLYANQPEKGYTSLNEIDNKLQDKGNHTEDINDLLIYNPDANFNYHIENYSKTLNNGELIEGYKVTIVTFYQDGEGYVTLASFFRGE